MPPGADSHGYRCRPPIGTPRPPVGGMADRHCRIALYSHQMDQNALLPDTLAQCDPTGSVDLEDPREVEAVIRAILDALPGGCYDPGLLTRAIDDLARAYSGSYPGLLRCDTLYHDLRHALETGLTMARLIDGQARQDKDDKASVNGPQALLGVLLALYHDIGLLRRNDEGHLWGASLTPIHEERGVEFMRGYLAGTSLAPYVDLAEAIMPTKLVFTMPTDWSPTLRCMGSMVATADLLSQMSDRYYLEKCRDFLFAEFGAIGLSGTAGSAYPDKETLLAKTPGFYTNFISKRLETEFGDVRRFMAIHFGGVSPYDEAILRNLDYLEGILSTQDFAALRREPRVFVPDVPKAA